jgi:O-antigen biosynthesis protein WbqP
MRVETPAVATHLLSDPHRWLTPIGGFLRATSIDELPQLWSILVGDMSFVGPRPALFNQEDLISLRNEYRVNDVRPGLTGLAQVRGRDSLSINEKVALDVEYVENQSIWNDLKILALTAVTVFLRRGVSH